jgi:hypothetical protein
VSNQSKVFELLYCLSRANELLGELTPTQLREAKRLAGLKEWRHLVQIAGPEQLENQVGSEVNGIGDMANVERQGRRRQAESFEDFSLPKVMQKVRSLVLHNTNSKGVFEIEWLLRILLLSPKLFSSTRELENFMSNITGLVHTTKSTGRDRIVDWYFRQLRMLPQELREIVVLRIARHIFVSLPSNYSEWNALLYEDAD